MRNFQNEEFGWDPRVQAWTEVKRRQLSGLESGRETGARLVRHTGASRRGGTPLASRRVQARTIWDPR
eukprot:1336733-Prymnesium_polylepis.1